MDRRLPLGAWDPLEPLVVMLIATNGQLRLLRRHIKRMFHLQDQILQNGIPHVTDEDVGLRMPIGQRLIENIRGIRSQRLHV